VYFFSFLPAKGKAGEVSAKAQRQVRPRQQEHAKINMNTLNDHAFSKRNEASVIVNG
jgi:hypothetical protein